MRTARLESNDHMRRRYQQPSRFVPVLNPLMKGLIHLGIPTGPMVLLKVHGRRSGRERSTPVAILQMNGGRYVVSVYGLSQWVQNLRADSQVRLKHGWKWEHVTVNELSTKEAAPVLMHAFKISPGFLRKYFDASQASTIEDFERDAVNHPVFQIHKGDRV